MKVARATLQKYFEAAGTAKSILSKKQQLNLSCLTYTDLEFFIFYLGFCFVLVWFLCFLTWEKQTRLCSFYRHMSTGMEKRISGRFLKWPQTDLHFCMWEFIKHMGFSLRYHFFVVVVLVQNGSKSDYYLYFDEYSLLTGLHLISSQISRIIWVLTHIY